jgi:quercetin dioxygenase-like cupin family protein
MAEHILDTRQFEFREFSEDGDRARNIQLCNLELKNCSATLVRYMPGAYVPKHMHTHRVISIVLEGEIAVEGVTVGPGSLIECVGEYGHRVIETSVLLLVIQPSESQYVPLE